MHQPLSRRRFLAAAASTTALFAPLAVRRPTWAAPQKPAAGKLPFTLGFSLYGMKTLPIEKALQTCAEIGFTDIEPALLAGYDTEPKLVTPARRKEIRSLADGLGLRIPCLMENIRPVVDAKVQADNFEKLARAAELAHAWKPADPAPAIIETVLGGKPAEWKTFRGPLIEGLGQWADAAKNLDIVIAVKAHIAGAMHTPDDTLGVVREVNSPHIKAAYDFSHFERQGFELEKSLRTLAPETVFIHVKDGRGVPGKFEFLLPGEGDIDYVRYFRLLNELRYAGSVTVEVSGQIHQKAGYDPTAAARKCFQSLHAAYEAAAAS
ncbi:MAG: sugar phosphate isomerase/epimerase [Pirellulales bacterium]